MKKISILFTIIFFVFSLSAQVYTEGTSADLLKVSSAINKETTATGTASFAAGYQTIASGDYSTSLGLMTEAQGVGSFAVGAGAKASTGFSVAIGRYVQANQNTSFAIGYGNSNTDRLFNNNSNSLVIGFKSNIPTLYVGPATGGSTLGNVGIGTTSPTTLLDINGTLNVEDVVTFRDNLDVAGTLDITDEATFGNNLSVAIKTITHQLQITDGASSNKILQSDAEGNATWANKIWTELQGEDLNYAGTGNVGIGESQPSAKLDVNGKTKTHELQITDGAGENMILRSDATGNTSWVEASTVVPNSPWVESGGNVYLSDATDKVGIGTSDPYGKLHIDMGTDKPDIVFKTEDAIDDNASDIRFITNANSGNTIFTTYTSNYAPQYKWQCGSSVGTYTAMSLELASGGTKLRLHGNLLCEQVEVMENVPNSDFVFEEDYELMSISDLESYVTTNHHLPEIPSAAEFKKDGYNMNDLDDLLLRKVEQLVLYAITAKNEREKMIVRIIELENENQQLKNERRVSK